MTLPPRHASSLGYFQTSVVNKQQYNNTQTGAHERRSQNPMVCRSLQENSRTGFLESPVFLPGESGISSWRVRYFFLESPVFLPGESGISSRRVRYFLRVHISASGATVRSCSSSGSRTGLGTQSPPGCTTSASSMKGDRGSGPSRYFGRHRVRPSVCARMTSCCASLPGSWPIYARNTASKLCVSRYRTTISQAYGNRYKGKDTYRTYRNSSSLRTKVNAATPRPGAARIAPMVEEV